MRKLLFTLIFLLTVITVSAQFSPTGTKTRFVNGLALGTKLDGSLSAQVDSNAIWWRADSALMVKYKGASFRIGQAGSGGSVLYSDTSAMLANRLKISDTLTQLSGYVRKNFPVLYTDTALMLSGYKTYYPRTALSLTTIGTSGAATYDNSTGVFNVPAYQAAGNYITALTGDVTATGPGSVAATLATVNTNTGAWGSSTSAPTFTVNGKGLITAASNTAIAFPVTSVAGRTGSIVIDTSDISNFYIKVRSLSTAGTGISYVNGIITNTSPSSGGTVTSVSAGTGMSFTTITGSGAVNADTTILSTKLNVLNQLNKYTGTSNTATVGIITTGVWNGTAIANANLANSTISGISLGANLAALTIGTHLTGTSYNGGTAVTIATDATNLNTVSTVVARDASGNFSAGTISAALTGNASTATTLQTARTINGINFDGSGNIIITANTTNYLTVGTDLSGSAFNGSSAITIANISTLATVTGRGNSTVTGISLTENGNLATSYALYLKRNTDTSPLGYLIQAQNVAATINLFTVDVSGNVNSNGTMNASNFSGTSSGTNTGDETTTRINALYGYTPANPALYLPLTGGTLTGNLTGTSLNLTGEIQTSFGQIAMTNTSGGGVPSTGVGIRYNGVMYIYPGSTAFSIRNNANNSDNLLVLDNGNTSITGSLTAGAISGTTGTFSDVITGQVNGNTFGASGATGRAVIIQAGSTNQAIQLKNSSGGDGTISATGTSTSLNYSFNTYSVADAFFIANGGNVGIGTASPVALLDVNGTATFASSVIATGITNNGQYVQSSSYSINGGNNAVFYNISSTGFGLYSQGGNATNYALKITDYLGTAAITVLGNGNTTVAGSITGTSIIKSGGTASQFLKADGSVDANAYLTAASASIYSGTYTPATGYDSTNCTWQSNGNLMYSRVGDVVTISGSFKINAAGAGAYNYAFSLPNSWQISTGLGGGAGNSSANGITGITLSAHTVSASYINVNGYATAGGIRTFYFSSQFYLAAL